MNPSCTLPTLVFLAILHGVSASPLDDVCNHLSGFNETPKLCRSVLCVDPACHTAPDVPSIKTMAAKLAVANATVARSRVEAAAQGRGAPEDVSGLENCLRLYNVVVPAMRWAARSVAAGRYGGARQMVSAAMDATGACRVMGRDATPEAEANGEFSMLLFVAFAVLNYPAT